LADSKKSNVTRRTLLKAGAAMPFVGIAAPGVLAQAPLKSPTKIHDFMTNADVAKAEVEGQFVFYCHENEPGTAGIMEGFRKDFPKINTCAYRKSSPGILVMQSTQDRTAQNASRCLGGT
jgi:predicted deacylase